MRPFRQVSAPRASRRGVVLALTLVTLVLAVVAVGAGVTSATLFARFVAGRQQRLEHRLGVLSGQEANRKRLALWSSARATGAKAPTPAAFAVLTFPQPGGTVRAALARQVRGIASLGPLSSALLEEYGAASKLNVNTASRAALGRKLPDLPAALLDAIVTRRAAAPLATLEELRRLRGMDDLVYGRLTAALDVTDSLFLSVATMGDDDGVTVHLSVLQVKDGRVQILLSTFLE